MEMLSFLVFGIVVQQAIASYRLPIAVVERPVGWTLNDVYGIKLTNYGDIEYYASIVVGTPKQQFRIVMDTGRFYGMDEVALGTIEDHGLLTPNLTFGVAKMIDRDTQADVIDGIMGLGFPQKHGTESLINRAIREKKLENPIYTIFLDKIGGDEHKPGGEIYFGGFDTTYCTKKITYVPLTTTDYWQFKADKVVVAGKVLHRNLQVVSDTGTSSLVMPQADFKRVMKAIGLPGKSEGLPYVPCKLKFILEIWINKVRHALTAQELMVRYSDGCVLEIDITEWEDDKTWVLGDPFCRSYCTVHDLGKSRIGFARAKVPKNWSRNRVSICGKKCQNAGRTQEQWFASRLRPPLDDSADTTPIPVYDPIEEEYLEE